MTLKLLIADDEADVAQVVAFGARMTWPNCQVLIAASGQEALTLFETEGADLIVLDVEMPPPDGFAVCQRVRETSQAPILMLTVRDATVDKVRALDLGADDYLTKPFDHLELLARLRALVRRWSVTSGQAADRFVSGEFSLDFVLREARLADETVPLTSTEYRLLEELARHAGTVVPHQVLLERVWGPHAVRDIHYLKVFVRRLRQKLGDDADQPRYIQTQWGVGYRFVGRQDRPPGMPEVMTEGGAADGRDAF